ncbi:phosphoribosyltransferase family protein [Catalinimonas niigatensis]|uniref:phosphoribosyltransferase family protein n=1 Tax=Catalinimonas niigatensis TaxID=1397264 RepID=UPI0026657123|nr:phosphoribosyltransferase family protein [Catalinimonas niigatensis]WPP52608.1 phosphoribosyltransferase family protein [Catalinimonas niigatensis]
MIAEPNTAPRIILNAEEIQQKIRRIAYEIYEHNFEDKQLILAGIVDRGFALAERIGHELNEISHFKYAQDSLRLVRIQLEKFTHQQCGVDLDCALEQLDGKRIILVDDVLNTGRTLAYSMRPFLERNIHKLEIAVLVNRSHSKFPVVANYTGYELATTLEEHIEVVLDGQSDAVYLK